MMDRHYHIVDDDRMSESWALTIKEISGRLKLSEKDVFRVLREHDIV
jgi:hypothetical protein